MVESEAFLDLLGQSGHGTTLVSADTISRRIRSKHESAEIDLQRCLSSNSSKLSFTTDLWTSPAGDPFMAVTCHYIDDDWTLRCVLLDFLVVHGSHTGGRLYKAFAEIVAPLDRAKDRFLAGCTDSASNNDTFITHLLQHGYLSSAESHMRCFAHVLNLAVQAAQREIRRSLDTLRESIKFLRNSPLAMHDFEHLCAERSYNTKFAKPILDCPTRWNSTCGMLEMALRLQEPSNDTFKRLFGNKSILERPREGDWENYRSLVQFFEPFRQATNMTCGEKVQTLSAVIPWYNVLLDHSERYRDDAEAELAKRHSAGISGTVSRRHRDEVADQSPEIVTVPSLEGRPELNPNDVGGEALDDIHDAAETAFAKLEQYFDISSDYCAIAVILDPRHKLDFFEEDTRSDDENKTERSKYQRQAQAIFDEYMTVTAVAPPLEDEAFSSQMVQDCDRQRVGDISERTMRRCEPRKCFFLWLRKLPRIYVLALLPVPFEKMASGGRLLRSESDISPNLARLLGRSGSAAPFWITSRPFMILGDLLCRSIGAYTDSQCLRVKV